MVVATPLSTNLESPLDHEYNCDLHAELGIANFQVRNGMAYVKEPLQLV